MASLSLKAQNVINSYLDLPFDGHSISCPYFNNRRRKTRGGSRAQKGKGTPDEIVEETRALAIRKKIDLSELTDEELTRFLVDSSLGVDCSGLVYHILDAETRHRTHKPLKDHLRWTRGIIRPLIARFRPAENTNVATLTHEANSRIVPLHEVRPGDVFAFANNDNAEGDRRHIILIHGVEKDPRTANPSRLYYTHSYSWPDDGKYGHGVRQGTIDITDLGSHITKQRWTEKGVSTPNNHTAQRASRAHYSSLHRLHALAEGSE